MILDSSAVVAIVFREPGWQKLLDRIEKSPQVAIGANTLVETTIVLSARMHCDARGLVARLLREAGIVVSSFSEAHYGLALEAWLRFGKGRHPASLNFGDCLSYATARLAGEPLLCVGEDFLQTDLDLA